MFFPIFRGFIVIVFYWWCLGFNVLGWELSSINYKLIFNFKHHFSKPIQIFKRSCFFSSLTLIVFLLTIIKENYLQHKTDYTAKDDDVILSELVFFSPYNGPMICWGVFFFYMFFPFKWFNYKGRKWLAILIFRCFFTPFFTMCFLFSFATDQLVSFVGPIKDMVYSVCFYFHYYQDYQPYGECDGDTEIFVGLFIAQVPLILRMI